MSRDKLCRLTSVEASWTDETRGNRASLPRRGWKGSSLDPRPATGRAYKQPLPPSRLDPGKKTVSGIIIKKQRVGGGQKGPSVSGSRVQAAAAGERTVGRQRAGHHKQRVHRWMHCEPLHKYWLFVHPSSLHLQRHQCKKAWVHQRLLFFVCENSKWMLRACWKSCRVFFVEETIIYHIKVKGWRKDSDACLFSSLGAGTSRTALFFAEHPEQWKVLILLLEFLWRHLEEDSLGRSPAPGGSAAAAGGSYRGTNSHRAPIKSPSWASEELITADCHKGWGACAVCLQKSIYALSTAALRQTVEMDFKWFFSLSQMKNEADLEAPKSWTTFDWDSEISVILLRYMTKCCQLSLGFQISSWPRKKSSSQSQISQRGEVASFTHKTTICSHAHGQIRVYN